jgi:predicted Zn-dependent peptidase
MPRVQRFAHHGLRVVCQHTPGPLTAIALSVRAGARFDGRTPGIAHMAEHMLFQGTTSLDQVALNRRAAELGGEHNADTGYETMSLTFEVFNDDRLQREAWVRFFRGGLAHPVCGSIKSLRAMQARQVAAFMRRHFTHPRSVLAVVGGVGTLQVRDAVRAHFNAGEPGLDAAPPAACFGATGNLRLRGGGGQAYITKLIAVPPEPRVLIAVGLALDLVGADPDSRLFQEVRERLGLGYDVSAGLDWGSDWAVAFVSASAARGAAQRLLRAVEDTCQRAAAEGFTADELLRARKKLRYRYASLAESRFDRALALAEGTLSGFPLPEVAERMVSRMGQAEVEAAWRNALSGRILTTMLAD